MKVFNLIRISKFCTQISRKDRITNIINNSFSPYYFEIVNESYKHSVPKESETHFKVVIVSDKFNGLNKINRHKEVYSILKDEWGSKQENKLHAFNLFAYTIDEYNKKENSNAQVFSSSCRNNNKV